MGSGVLTHARPDLIIPSYVCPTCEITCSTWHRRRHEQGARHKARARRLNLHAQGWCRMGSGNHLTYKALGVPMKRGPSTVDRFGITYAYWIPAWARMLMQMIECCIGLHDRKDSQRSFRKIANNAFREVRGQLVSRATEDFWSHCNGVTFAALIQEAMLRAVAKAKSRYYLCPKCGRLVYHSRMSRHFQEGEHKLWLEIATNVS